MLFKPLLDGGQLARSKSLTRSIQAAAVGAAVVALCACNLPFDLGLPATRAVENGAAESLTNATTFALKGTYAGHLGEHWVFGMTVARPGREQISVSGPSEQLGAIIIGSQAYFSGQAFLAKHMGTDPLSQSLVKAAGSAWWEGSTDLAPKLPDLIDGTAFRATFLGSNVTKRTDHLAFEGAPAIELSGPRADVFVHATPPYFVLGLVMRKGVVVDGLGQADLRYANFNSPLEITVPGDVIDFSNLTTLPPIYSVVSVDTSGCGSPCVVSAQLKNLGGQYGASAPSTITFTMKAAASGSVIGSCQALVTPDVGYNATTTVSCTISLTSQPENAAVVTATADNPGHA